LFDDAGNVGVQDINNTGYQIVSLDYIYFTLTDYTDAAIAKTWFASHPTTLIYPLKKSV